jgi:hypothetical protein
VQGARQRRRVVIAHKAADASMQEASRTPQKDMPWQLRSCVWSEVRCTAVNLHPNADMAMQPVLLVSSTRWFKIPGYIPQ